MESRFARTLAYTALLVALPTATFWLGFREGAEMGVMLDSVPRGGISIFHLKSMEKGLTRNMATALHADVDQALLWAHKVERHPLLPFVEPLWGIPSLSGESLARLANYRKAHPSPLRSESLAQEPMPSNAEAAALRASILEGARDSDRIISSMVAKHASTAASSSTPLGAKAE